MVSVDDFLSFLDEALDGMVAIVEQLGDELANRRPDAPGTNTPYVILTHCLGVMEYWAGQVVAGRPITRDRAAEFVSAGPVAPLVERVGRARAQLQRDLLALEPYSPPLGGVSQEDAKLPLGRTQGGALLHVYEELAQHRGQMESLRDVLLAPWVRVVPQVTGAR